MILEKINNRTKYAIWFLMAVVLYFVFFHRLGTYPIRTWDESVYAVYSYEMMQSGNYIVPHLNGQIDYLNDKPPLFFWSQIASIKLFGYNEFSVRFPSALFGALTVLMLFLFLAKRFSFYLGLSVALVLTCTVGFVTFHSARTGDMDTMLAFGLTGSALSLIVYFQDQSNKYLISYFLFVLFSFFTKSITGLFLLPAHALIILAWRREMLRNMKIWLGIIITVLFIVSYIFVRDKYENGYFTNHFMEYLGKFQSHFNEAHNKPWDFYINNLFNERYSHFIFLLLPAVVLNWWEKDPRVKQLVSIVSISALVYFFIILISPTKCYWYDVPLFPLMAVIVGYMIWKMVLMISALTSAENFIPMALILTFLPSLYYAVKRSYNNQIPQQERRIEVVHDFFLKNGKQIKFEKMKVVNDNYIAPMLFYKYNLKEQGKDLVICNVNDLQSGDIFITGNDSVKKIVEAGDPEVIQIYKQATVYKIK